MLKFLKALAVAAMMFVPVSVGAVCATDNMTPADTSVCEGPPANKTQNGITIDYIDFYNMNFWITDKDGDAPGIQCAMLNPYVPWDGDFANEPSANYALRRNYNAEASESPIISFTANPKVTTITFRYGSSNDFFSWDCTGISPFCPIGSPCICLQNPALPSTVRASVGGQWVVAGTLDEEGAAEHGAPCSGDSTGWICNWGEFSYYNANGIDAIHFTHAPLGGQAPFWIDDLVVCNEACPDPPCGFESASRPRVEHTAQPRQRTSWGRIKTIYR